jgi:hypothetical protein
MAKPNRNEEFHNAQVALYAKAQLSPRAKGQRFDRAMLGDRFLNQQGQISNVDQPMEDPVVNVQYLGTSMGYSGHGSTTCLYRAFAVTLQSGMIVPCYSRDEDSYVMCQNYAFKSRQG